MPPRIRPAKAPPLVRRPPSCRARVFACSPTRPALRRARTLTTSTTITAAADATPSPRNATLAQLKQTLRTLEQHGYGADSRLQLALRSLEQENAPVRVGVTGSRSDRLVEALLREPLVPRAQDLAWLESLRHWAAQSTNEGRGLLIRYGPDSKLTTPVGSPISILAAPVDALKTRNIELVLSHAVTADPVVPKFQATDAPGARVIEYPVHRAVFFAGYGSAGISLLLSQGPGAARNVLKLVSLPVTVPKASDAPDVRIVDLDLATDALKRMQQSTANAMDYEREWLASGVQGVKDWLLQSSETEHGLRKPVAKLLRDVLEDAEAELEKDVDQLAETPLVEELPRGESLEVLSKAIATWSEASHCELRDSLDGSFAGDLWRRIKWWKLYWSVDDVGITAKDVVNDGFLKQSERDSTFLAGRICGAGYGPSPETSRPQNGQQELQVLERAEADTANSSLKRSSIQRSREGLIETSIPALQLAAQKYMLGSLSISTLSWATSALLYLSEVSLYSSLTVAALGTVGSMRLLQKRWGKEQKKFAADVQEKGRQAIVETERWAWASLKSGLRKTEDAELEARRSGLQNLRKAVTHSRKLLDSVD